MLKNKKNASNKFKCFKAAASYRPIKYIRKKLLGIQPSLKYSSSDSSTFRCTQSRPKVRVQQPLVSVQQPRVRLQQPRLRVQQPRVRVQQPLVSVQQPRVRVQQPRVRVQQPRVRVQQPLVCVQQPRETHTIAYLGP